MQSEPVKRFDSNLELFFYLGYSVSAFTCTAKYARPVESIGADIELIHRS